MARTLAALACCTFSRAAASRTARASGCSLPAWIEALIASNEDRSPRAASTATSCGLPSVRVPVLSKATTFTLWAISSACASLIRMPWRAATPVPAMMAVGVARPSAQGQAMTSTATALRIAASQSPEARPQPSSVTSAIAITTGTKTSLTRSTSRCTGAFLAWAVSTSRMIRASVDSAPTAVVFTSSRPSAFTEPPVIMSPSCFATGRLSPVIRDWSMWLAPSTTIPSTGTRSPGRTTTRSSRATLPMGTSMSWPPRRTRAVSGRSALSARMASVVWRLARVSSHLPSNTRVMTTAEASKYR